MSPILLGHRGSPHQFRENTMPGYQAALAAGLDGVEVDVRRLVDGTLVLHHDAHLPDGRFLRDLRRSEVPAWLPTLPEFLAWMADTGTYANIEFKWEREVWRPDDRVERTLDLVRGLGLGRRVLVSSFNPLYLLAARQVAPEIERGFLFERELAPALITTIMKVTASVALHPRFSLIDRELMALARQRGWRVNTWTVNDVAEVQRLTGLGVDALIGNFPEVLLTARRRPDTETI
ncbi:glycerophosphodiester phosphodiesterase [Deinococcus fonticola]|uniref:glycerophosphodiester phosphodiesterase n=1 Tax=Deinococcus fonticola TaxID=2528713 RepID=UPI00107553C8|nr:glycerophosphodiester phosphodiesterase [Deinococcus fonticola]